MILGAPSSLRRLGSLVRGIPFRLAHSPNGSRVQMVESPVNLSVHSTISPGLKRLLVPARMGITSGGDGPRVRTSEGRSYSAVKLVRTYSSTRRTVLRTCDGRPEGPHLVFPLWSGASSLMLHWSDESPRPVGSRGCIVQFAGPTPGVVVRSRHPSVVGRRPTTPGKLYSPFRSMTSTMAIATPSSWPSSSRT